MYVPAGQPGGTLAYQQGEAGTLGLAGVQFCVFPKPTAQVTVGAGPEASHMNWVFPPHTHTRNSHQGKVASITPRDQAR